MKINITNTPSVKQAALFAQLKTLVLKSMPAQELHKYLDTLPTAERVAILQSFKTA